MSESSGSLPDGVDGAAFDAAAAALRRAIDECRGVCVLTGAGVSAESGVPTFRGASATRGEDQPYSPLWTKYDPMQLASIEGFRADPEAVTRWYAWRRALVLGCEPNAGHVALAELEGLAVRAGGGFCLATQNVDRLHHRAGSGSHGGDVFELHGTLVEWRTVSGRRSYNSEELSALLAEGAPFPPRCPESGEPLRPGVVWFGEALPAEAIEGAHIAASSCGVFITAGTSSTVYPAAGLVHVAAQAGAFTIEVNPDATPATGSVDAALRATSAMVLPALVGAASG